MKDKILLFIMIVFLLIISICQFVCIDFCANEITILKKEVQIQKNKIRFFKKMIVKKMENDSLSKKIITWVVSYCLVVSVTYWLVVYAPDKSISKKMQEQRVEMDSLYTLLNTIAIDQLKIEMDLKSKTRHLDSLILYNTQAKVNLERSKDSLYRLKNPKVPKKMPVF
jgi:hypothetical protein